MPANFITSAQADSLFKLHEGPTPRRQPSLAFQSPIELTGFVPLARQPGITIPHSRNRRRVARLTILLQPGKRPCGAYIGNSGLERHRNALVFDNDGSHLKISGFIKMIGNGRLNGIQICRKHQTYRVQDLVLQNRSKSKVRDFDKSKPNCCRKLIASGAIINQPRAPRLARTGSQKTN